MFDSGIKTGDLISMLKSEVDVAGEVPNGTYVMWLNALEQLLYSEFIHEQNKIEIPNPAANTVKISTLPAKSYGNPITVYYPPPYSDRNQLYYYNGVYYYWNGSAWAVTTNANFGTVFQQTAGGFTFKGNVRITGDMITSGTITGTALQSVDTNGGKEVYVNNGMIIFRYYSSPMGGIYYDNQGQYPDNPQRVFVYSAVGQALKIQSGGNMSIQASGTVYADGNWQIGANGTVSIMNRLTLSGTALADLKRQLGI